MLMQPIAAPLQDAVALPDNASPARGLLHRTRPRRSAAFPQIFAGKRRWMVVRLLLNGAGQAGGTLALPLLLGASGTLGPGLTALALSALAGGLIALRVQELRDAERLGLDYVAEVRIRLLNGILKGRGTAHGVAMSRLMNDLSALRQWVGLGLARSVSAALAFCGCACAAALISEAHLLAILAPAAFVLIAGGATLLPLTQRVREVRRRRGKLARLLGESLLALPEEQDRAAVRTVRRRVARSSSKLNDALLDRIRVASVLRVLPDGVLPLVMICAVATGLETGNAQVSLILLAGLAAGPLTQALRAAEYRIAFSIARERLAPGLGH
ncbi:MAG: hypothetical protein AAF675_15465 [Pseudomonadota bacterium]